MNNLTTALFNHNISESVIDSVMHNHLAKDVDVNECVLKNGQICDKIYFIEKGGFVINFWNESTATERTVGFHTEHLLPFMSEVVSYFGNAPSLCSIEAFKKARILVFKKSYLEQLAAENSEFATFYTSKIMEALIYESELRMRLISQPKEDFYKYLIENRKDILANIPSKYIANFMGISAEWLSKVKRRI